MLVLDLSGLEFATGLAKEDLGNMPKNQSSRFFVVEVGVGCSGGRVS